MPRRRNADHSAAFFATATCIALSFLLLGVASGFVVPPPASTNRQTGLYAPITTATTAAAAAATTTTAAPSALGAVSKRTVAVLDGAELASIECFLASELRSDDDDQNGGSSAIGSRIGYMTVVAGTTEDDGAPRRVVGVEVANGPSSSSSSASTSSTSPTDAISLGDGVSLHRHTVATIPPSISDEDAVSTTIAALVGVHCGLPRVDKIGGSDNGDDDMAGSFAGGKVVVLGGGEYAAFAADGMAALGADVTLVSTSGNPKTKNKGVKVMKPATGKDEIGFSTIIGDFDSLVDTLFDEGKLDSVRQGPTGVIEQLQLQHGCDNYVSTFSESQRIIRKKGLLFGRNDAKNYVLNAMTSSIGAGTGRGGSKTIVPPKGFGPQTVQKLLDDGIIYPATARGKSANKDVVVREWSLKDFWEYTSWPRDSGGTGTTRYGLPVLDDDVLQEQEEERERLADEEVRAAAAAALQAEGNDRPIPYVTQIRGVDGLKREIVGPKKHAVVFLSATWCRTCKYLRPKFSKMAREAEEADSELTFAQGDTTGVEGKLLSRTLDVDAVPAFVMFRDGEVYGEPLSVSKLPSRKLDLAVEYLTSGREYDAEAIRGAKY